MYGSVAFSSSVHSRCCAAHPPPPAPSTGASCSPAALSPYTPAPLPPAAAPVLSVSVSLTVQVSHGGAHTVYLFFGDWLISLSIMFPRFIHTAAGDRVYFLFKAKSHSLEWMHHVVLMGPSARRHLCCFHLSDLVRSAAVSPGVEVSEPPLSLLWGLDS